MEYNSGSNRASDLKLQARLPLNCMTRSPINYQLIASIKNTRNFLSQQLKKGCQNLTKTYLNTRPVNFVHVFNLHLTICYRKKFSFMLIGYGGLVS